MADGKFVTGHACGSAFDFGLKLVEVLRGRRLPMLSTTSSTTVAEDKAALRRQVRLTFGPVPGGGPPRRRRPVRRLLRPPQAEAASTLFAFWASWAGSLTGRLIRALTARGKRVGLPGCCPAGRWRCGCMSRTAPGPGVLRDPGAASGRPLLARPDIDLALVPAVL